MMGSKLRKVQSDADKEQDAEENTRVQLEEPHISEEQHSKLITPTEPKKREHFVSFPGELSTNTDNETLPEQLIKLDNENKHQGYRIAELEAYILKLQGSESLAEPEFKGNKAVDNQQILEEKLRECEVMLEDRTDESKTLRKKLNEMELSYHQLQFECDALKGKLASVRELESLDSLSSEDESEVKHSAKAELLQRVKSLEGLLKIQEMSEKELTETVKELQGELLRSQENQRLLGLRCDKLDQLTKEKEDVESKLEERYSQVEQLQKEKEKSEEDYQEQIKMLIDEIKERDEAHSQLEAIYKDLLLKVGEMEESKTSLESKVAKFKMDLEERVDNELKLKKQCSDLEKTIRDWENFEQQLKEQFKRVESKQNGKIKSLRKQLEEKDETLKKTLQVVEELKKSIKDAESQLHERQHIAPEILKEKKQLEAELSRKADAEIDKAGFIVKMRSRFEMEVNEKSKELEDCKDEIECLNEEIGQLREQHWQQKEAERKLQERTKMLEELVEETKEGETKVLQEKIARMEKLISMKEETVETLQARIGKQETLLKEMEETERRLAQRNEELGVKQRGMSEELHCWRTKCSNLEKFEREVKFETKCQRDKIKDLEITKTNLEVQLQKKISEFEELGLLKKKELANVTAELNKKIEELEFKESVCRAAKQNVEMQLKKRMKEFEISEANVKNLQRKLEEALEEKQSGIRNVETTMRQEKAALEAELAKWSQSVISLETMIKEESQISLNLKGQLHTKEAALKMLQEEHSVLLVRIQGLEQDLEETKKDGTKRTEWENNKREMDVLNQRLEELTQSEEILKQTIDNFTKTEAALQRRIQDLELSEQRLLDKINELTSKSQQSMTSDPQLTGKLRSLQISEKDLKFLLAEKEKSEELLKGKLWRLQNQLRMKEDEMKNQSEYFEHYKQKQQQQMVKLREREQFLHSQIFKLDRERIDLNATSIILKTELQQVTAKFTKLEKVQSKRSKELSEHDIELANVARSVSEREDQVKDSILVLQDDLNKLLAKEEAINREKEQLRERLQQAEDNEDFLTHKLEDFRSRIHELKLSESSLQEQAEELEEENEKLRTELKQIQENENYLKEVLEEKEKLERLVEEKNKLHNMTLNNSELQLSSDEMPIHETSLEVTSKRLSNFCSAMFQNVDEETSPNRYRDLKNSLTHLRSQLQNGDILFREELLQSKWAAVLDSARNKNTQTPSIGQCVQEALIIAKLASESVCDYPKLSTAVKEGRIIPFLEANSCLLADLMQVLRTGDVEKEKDQSLKKLKLDYDILQRKLMDIEEKSATGDIKLKHEGQVLQGKQSLAKKPVTEMLQLTLIERNNALEKLLEKTEMELKLKQEELDKTKTEAQKWHREVVSAESSAEKVQVDLTEVLSEVERLRKTVREQGRLKESDVELALRRENFQLKDQLTALNERNRNMDNLKARCSVMKKEVAAFEELGRKKTEAELLIAPLKAKLSCLIQKCHRRNSLIIQLVRELYRHGFTNTGLIEEAEDMLNDTAILEYTRTFLSLGNQQGNMNTNSVPAGTPQQEQGLNHWFPSSLFHERQALLDSSAALTYRPHVAIADYRPYSNMPHTVLPVLPLSVGDVVLVSGDPDRHGMYVAEVNGELGLVPARFVEETNSILHLHTTRNKPTAGYRKNSPERITTLCQLPQHTQGNNDQVAPSVINSDADYNLLSIPCLSHKDVPQPFVSRSHDNLEDINFEACGKTTGQGQEEEHLFKSAEQFHYAPGDCCEISYGWACNDRGNQKSILSAGENTSSAALPEMATRSNLSERLATTLQGHTIKHRAAANWHDGKTSKMTQEPPAPVTSLHINGPIGQNSLLIEWEKPVLDENGCSNGTFIQGYRIFIDGEFYKSTMGSACTKILLEDLDLSVPFQVSIQTVGANGLVSEKLTVLFLNCQLREKPLSVQPLPSLTDQSNKSSEMLQFLAVYDYNPLQDSPNIHPSHELAFKEGDIICLYGKQRKDGFCEAEVNGRRGLVPTSFLGARIELPKTLEHKASRSASSPPGHHGTPEIPQSSEDICKQKLNNRQRLMRRI
ncbi:restin homolog isoform X11 [Rhincodon typus]|uniref:restin homolog isoform X11 n=1 Tax=Rhincodon typus TaxID=259920 RepID=UPI00202DEB52|nr:restin homolog isoform X11 [Rhincodon typus]